MNTAPEKADGELALWLDGKPTLHIGPGTRRGQWTGLGFDVLPPGDSKRETFEGFRWRTTPDLKVNYFWLMHYVTDLPARQNRVANPRRENAVWFDDIVIATTYIGPVAGRR
jgi:hypothetical protein